MSPGSPPALRPPLGTARKGDNGVTWGMEALLSCGRWSLATGVPLSGVGQGILGSRCSAAGDVSLFLAQEMRRKGEKAAGTGAGRVPDHWTNPSAYPISSAKPRTTPLVSALVPPRISARSYLRDVHPARPVTLNTLLASSLNTIPQQMVIWTGRFAHSVRQPVPRVFISALHTSRQEVT